MDRRIRTLGWIVAALVAGTGVVVATETLSSAPNAGPARRSPSRPPVADPSVSLPPENQQSATIGRPIWPRDRSCPRGRRHWRRDPRATATHFARAVLGWRYAHAAPPFAADDAGDLNSEVRMTAHDGRRWHGTIHVSMSRRTTRCWFVLRVSGWGTPDPRVRRRGDRLIVVPYRSAPSIHVVARFGTTTLSKTFGNSPARLELRGVPHARGTLFLTFRNVAGRTFSAAALRIPR